MPIPYSFGGLSGGNGGLHFRRPPDVFANAAARTAYFGLLANAAVYLEFAKDKSLAIIIGTIANPTGFQTYTGDPADSYADAKWLDRTDAVQSVTPGSQGIYERSIYRNSSVIISVAPVGGSINVGTGVVTPPADWTFNPTAPLVGEDTYRSIVSINPDTQSGDIVPIWSLPIDIRGSVNVADIDARIGGPARAINPVGAFDDSRIPAGIARDTEVTAAIAGIMGRGAIDLGVATPTIDRLTVAAPSGYSRYPRGTLLLFELLHGQLDSSWTSPLSFYIGTDRYNLRGVKDSDIRYDDLQNITCYLAVVKGTIQILGPVKVPGFTIAEVLARIRAGTGVGIDTSFDGYIILSAAGGTGGVSDGTLSAIVMDSSAQTIKFTSTLGSPITLDISDLVTATELATALTPYTKADGTVAFTAVVAGIAPTDDDHLSTKEYVDDADVLKASLSGATFTGEARGLTPVNDPDFATKAYVDAAVAGTTLPSVRSELIYYGQILAANAADLAAAITYAETIDVSTLDMEDAAVAGHNITVGPSAVRDFFLILVPATHDLLTLINTGTQADARSAYSRSMNARNDLGTPSEQYNSYVLGPLNPSVSISYRLTLTE